MAQYSAQVYAIDSYESDGSRRDTLLSWTKYDGVITSGTTQADSSQSISIQYPAYDTVTQYAKKRYTSRSYSQVYVTSVEKLAKMGNGDGYFGPGTYDSADGLLENAVIKNYAGNAWTAMPDGDGYFDMPSGSDTHVESDTDVLHYPAIGFIDGYFGTVTYHVYANYIIYSHTGTHPPYSTFYFEDVAPYASSLTPANGGKTPKFCDNTFSWKFDYDDDNVVAKLTQKSAKFRWRAYGDTAYSELSVGTDQFITVPKNTFKSEIIEWQVVLTSDDNVAGTPSAWTTANTYVVPYATNFYPNLTGGVAAKHGETTFSWQFTFDTANVTEPLTQKSAKFRYRPYGVTAYTEITVGTDQYCKLPAETFSSEFMEWQVALTSSDDVTGAFSAWVKVPTSDTISTPLIRYPIGQIINGKLLNRFAWLHVNSTNTIQTRYEAQYSLDNGTTWLALSTAVTSIQYFDIPADTFPAGNLAWRVRTYNTDSVVGNWSETATVVVKSTPPTPTITTETITPRPTLEWISTDQQAFQIQVGAYNSGTIYGGDMQYSIPVYLDNGTHTIKVRTQNAYGYWSDWGERSFILNVAKPNTPILSVISNYDRGLRLAVSYTTPKCILYRRDFGTTDFYSIATLTAETEYTDYTVASGVRYEYFARAVDTDNSFADSDIVDGSIELCSTYIYDIANPQSMVEFRLRLETGYGREHTYSKAKTYTNFVGREYPASEINGTKEHTLPQSYLVKAYQYNAVMALADADTVLYRNELGQLMYGSIDGVTLSEKFSSDKKSYLVSFTVRQIDYTEGGERA